MRLIDADELTEMFREVIGHIFKEPTMTKDMEHMVRASAMTIEMISDAPTVDAVPVVRCKDCIFSRKVDDREPKYKCVNICRDGCTQWVGSEDFCSHGERRNDDKDRTV